MTTSVLNEYKTIIDTLKYQYANRELGDLLRESLGATATHSLIFQIKMEIQRLAKPGLRPIRVQEFNEKIKPNICIIDEQEHHMDEATEEEFKRLYQAYGNKFTVGMEESIKAFVKHHADNIIDQEFNKDIDIHPVKVSDQIHRSEERMHLGVKVEIWHLNRAPDKTTKPLAISNRTCDATGVTQDISFSGVKIKTLDDGESSEYVAVRFVGLEKEYKLGQPYVFYRRLRTLENTISPKTEQEDAVCSWLMEKCEVACHREFDFFIKGLIHANSSRYKVDVANVERSVTHQIIEQFATNRQRGFAVFFDNDAFRYAYGNQLGSQSWRVFNRPEGHVFSSLMEKDQLLSRSKKSEVYWLMIAQKNGAFFSCVLDNTEISRDFFNYALTREDACLFKISQDTCHPERAFSINTLPTNNTTNAPRRQIDHYAPNTRSAIKEITGVLHIYPLDKKRYAKTLGKSHPLTTERQKAFSTLALKSAPSLKPTFIRASARELRREDRFNYRVPVTLNIRHQILKGTLTDISLSGIGVRLDDRDEPCYDNQVRITIHHEIQGAVDLHYKIVENEKGCLHLQADSDKARKTTTKYWHDFIDQHFNRLTPLKEYGHLPGLERSLRNLYNISHPDIKTIMKIKQSRAIPTHTALSNAHDDDVVFGNAGVLHEPSPLLKTLFCDADLQEYCSSAIRKVSKETPFVNTFIAVLHLKDGHGNVKVRRVMLFDETSATPVLRNRLIKKMQEKGLLISWYDLSITRKSRIFDRYYHQEMSYIERFFPHRADALLDLSAKTVAVVSLTPIDSWFSCWSEKAAIKNVQKNA